MKKENKYNVYDITTGKILFETPNAKLATLHRKEIQEKFNSYGVDLSIYDSCSPIVKNKVTLEKFIKEFRRNKTKKIEQLAVQERILSKVTSDYKSKKAKEKMESIKNSLVNLSEKINEFENEILRLSD